MAISKNAKKLIRMICVTVIALIIYRFGAFIKMPFVKITYSSDSSSLFGFLDVFTGGALSNISVLCLGISPYITSSIVIQLLQMDIIPQLKEWSEEGEEGRNKLNQLTKYIALALAFIQGLTVVIGLYMTGGNAYFDTTKIHTGFYLYAYLSIVATAGTAFSLWLSEKITRYGVGNGSSMLIVAGILAAFPQMIGSLSQAYLAKTTDGTTANEAYAPWKFVIILFLLLVIILGVVFMEGAQRKIPVQYANRPSQAQFMGKNDSNIPIKLNSASVIPVIFAATLMSIPTTILSIAGSDTSTGFAGFVYNLFTTSQPLGFALYIVLIIVFSFFYSFLQMNPEKMAENLQKNNAFVPGYRPGEETASYISRVLFKITVVGATYLAIVAALPIIISWIFPDASGVSIGGTSIIIIIGVAIETVKQLKVTTQEQSYKGFLD